MTVREQPGYHMESYPDPPKYRMTLSIGEVYPYIVTGGTPRSAFDAVQRDLFRRGILTDDIIIRPTHLEFIFYDENWMALDCDFSHLAEFAVQIVA
tara:strand:+ start:1180 stop:1467 length:288 start_codon:yes stop_codon:yes gene_type:complete